MHKKKVWIINHYATNSYYNKSGRHYWFSENLMKRGYSPVIFCANVRHSTDDRIELGTRENHTIKKLKGIPYVFIKTISSKGNGLKRIINIILFYINLLIVAKKHIKTYGKPDVIIASSVHPLSMVAGIQIARKLNVPCICEIRDLWPEAIFSIGKAKENSYLGRLLISGEHWIYKNADALIFTKEGDVDYILERMWDIEQGGDIDIKKCHYINNGVDIKKFDKLSTENKVEDRDLANDKFKVVYIGSIRPVNNIDKILDAAAHLKEEKDIQFLIYGDGNEKPALIERIRNENLTNVKIKGYVNRLAVPYILSKSSVNLLNYSQSRYNWSRGNSSNKMFEYMASGKPIISTVKMGYSIIDKYNCGIELENGSGKELASAILHIKKMENNKYEEMGLNAKTGVRDFDFKQLTSQLEEVINSVIKN